MSGAAPTVPGAAAAATLGKGNLAYWLHFNVLSHARIVRMWLSLANLVFSLLGCFRPSATKTAAKNARVIRIEKSTAGAYRVGINIYC